MHTIFVVQNFTHFKGSGHIGQDTVVANVITELVNPRLNQHY